jgi:aspartate dehydrogenase
MRRTKRRRVGILGYGEVGKFLAEALLDREEAQAVAELAFVWNRSEGRLRENEARVPERHWLVGADLGAALSDWKGAGGEVDLIVEMSHPAVVHEFGARLLDEADLLVGSPSAFARQETEQALRHAAESNPHGHGCYVPSGAAWGIADIARMDRVDALTALSVAMTFHADSLRDLAEPLRSELARRLESPNGDGEVVLYDGPVRPLCALAPNNVNTMAALSLAASRLGFDGVMGRLKVAENADAHVVEIEVTGRGGFHVSTRRHNPARVGAVTGAATFASFLSSLLQAHGRGNGIHFC